MIRSLSNTSRWTYSVALLAAFTGLPAACSSTSSEAPAAATAGALGATAPVLGTAKSFTVLGGSTVTNTNVTTITGDLGVSPGLAITGFPPGIVLGGAVHAGDAVALQAQTDTTAAYGALAGQACSVDLSGKDLGGLTLTPGVYCFSSSAQLTGALVLDAGGRADAVFVFKTVSTLITASNATVHVVNGGTACGVYWMVGSSATLGTNTAFEGSVLALTSITLNTGATLSGRALARNGAVTMDHNTIGVGACASALPSDAGAGGAADAAAPKDAAVEADAGVVPVDAGVVPVDAGDAGVVPVDAGDAGVAPVDAGGASDAGTGTGSTP
jgi:hypothetical protein